ncbi:hypothetical protein [Cellulomonas iranensis]|uniref:hypothetical protein n=1 Tax=Cellulomonas iranensis TaxID=76862 RepID=UPI003D7E1CE0
MTDPTAVPPTTGDAPTHARRGVRRSPAAVRRELGQLASGEAVSGLLLPPLLVWFARPKAGDLVVLLPAAGALGVALLVAAAFWWRRARGHVPLRWLRVTEATLLACGVVALAVLATLALGAVTGAGPDVGARTAAVAAGTAAFTVVEVVNYRWVQISARGWTAWARGRVVRPQLARELDRHARRRVR